MGTDTAIGRKWTWAWGGDVCGHEEEMDVGMGMGKRWTWAYVWACRGDVCGRGEEMVMGMAMRKILV